MERGSKRGKCRMAGSGGRGKDMIGNERGKDEGEGMVYKMC